MLRYAVRRNALVTEGAFGELSIEETVAAIEAEPIGNSARRFRFDASGMLIAGEDGERWMSDLRVCRTIAKPPRDVATR